MGPLGVPEMLFILVLILLIFGPKRLPEVGKMVGKGLGEFRRASNELKRSIQTELSLEELEEGPARPRPLAAVAPAASGAVLEPSAPAATVAQEPFSYTAPVLPTVDPLEGPPTVEEEPAAVVPSASPIVPE
ncbi:MAG TPA: twin-arginine translocase TatA/TatE family subunit [Thermoanaerobaculia bacterium]|nr:twin-arginine translocase TatA/TatE family subunit [Thermoanaerobaculia bacterium]